MQKLCTVRVTFATPANPPIPPNEVHLQEDLESGWRIAQITPIGTAALDIGERGKLPLYIGWFAVVLEKVEDHST